MGKSGGNMYLGLAVAPATWYNVREGKIEHGVFAFVENSELPKKLTLNKLALIGKAEKSP